jgi:ribosomal protein S27AE
MKNFSEFEEDDPLLDDEICPKCGSDYFVFNYELDKLECGDCGFIPNNSTPKSKNKKTKIKKFKSEE